MKQNISPFLWFDRNAEEAMNFYVSVFKDVKVLNIKRYPPGPLEGPMKGFEGQVLTEVFELLGQKFMALDGGPIFKFNPSISLMVLCDTKEEVDRLWNELSQGGSVLMPLDKYPFSERYGWLQDRFGLSWQIGVMSGMEIKQKIVTTLMFVGDVCGKAEEAMNYYTSIFPDSSIGHIMRYENSGGTSDKEGTVKHAGFTLNGVDFAAMDSAYDHKFNFNEAISIMVQCDSQEEIDKYWNELSAVPESEQCGWLKDKYGVSWQIVPNMESFFDMSDPEKFGRAMQAMLQMKKIDIATLQRAYDGVE